MVINYKFNLADEDGNNIFHHLLNDSDINKDDTHDFITEYYNKIENEDYNDDKMKRSAGIPMNELKAGHIFHAITYGLNAMGPHASQLSEDERWKITLYVQEELQHYGK